MKTTKELKSVGTKCEVFEEVSWEELLKRAEADPNATITLNLHNYLKEKKFFSEGEIRKALNTQYISDYGQEVILKKLGVILKKLGLKEDG